MKSFGQTQDLKVALVHDYLREYGGAERVVEALHEIFPQAPVYTAYYRSQGLGPHAQRLKEWDIRTSWLQKVPFANRLVSPMRILAPLMFQSFDLSAYDVVISSSAIYFANAVKTKPSVLHLAYIHTPPRYLYGIATSYERKKHFWLTQIGVMVANHLLRIWDFQINQRPDILIANSQNVAERIKKFYRREPVVIYPPVAVEKFDKGTSSPYGRGSLAGDGYYLSVCRLWKNKGVDVIIQACKQLDLPLKVVGIGPEYENLQRLAGGKTEMLGEVSDEEKVKLYQKAQALIVAAQDEDFGITAVEAQAAGIPVVAINSGGYKESVVAGKTGEFFNQCTVEALVEVLGKFNPSQYKAEDCRKQAEKFSEERFKEEILEIIAKNIKS